MTPNALIVVGLAELGDAALVTPAFEFGRKEGLEAILGDIDPGHARPKD